ncbi:hypothetical protein [Streptomyces sp. NPDC004788]
MTGEHQTTTTAVALPEAMEVPIHFEDRTVGESEMNPAVQLESLAMPWKLRARSVGGG